MLAPLPTACKISESNRASKHPVLSPPTFTPSLGSEPGGEEDERVQQNLHFKRPTLLRLLIFSFTSLRAYTPCCWDKLRQQSVNWNPVNSQNIFVITSIPFFSLISKVYFFYWCLPAVLKHTKTWDSSVLLNCFILYLTYPINYCLIFLLSFIKKKSQMTSMYLLDSFPRSPLSLSCSTTLMPLLSQISPMVSAFPNLWLALFLVD